MCLFPSLILYHIEEFLSLKLVIVFVSIYYHLIKTTNIIIIYLYSLTDSIQVFPCI